MRRETVQEVSKSGQKVCMKRAGNCGKRAEGEQDWSIWASAGLVGIGTEVNCVTSTLMNCLARAVSFSARIVL